MRSANANATTIGADRGVRRAVLGLADAVLGWAVESAEDIVAAVLCFLHLPAGIRRHLAREEKRALAVELVVSAAGRHHSMGADMALIGAGPERKGVLSFPVGARSCSFVDGAGEIFDGEACRPSQGEHPGGYKVLDAVLLRRCRGPVKTETLAWRVSRRGITGRETAPAETYPDREQALLDFYSG